jgi:hypothetical protein
VLIFFYHGWFLWFKICHYCDINDWNRAFNCLVNDVASCHHKITTFTNSSWSRWDIVNVGQDVMAIHCTHTELEKSHAHVPTGILFRGVARILKGGSFSQMDFHSQNFKDFSQTPWQRPCCWTPWATKTCKMKNVQIRTCPNGQHYIQGCQPIRNSF